MLEKGFLASAYNPNTLKVEAGESGVQGLSQQENHRLKIGSSYPVGSRLALVKLPQNKTEKEAGVRAQW